MYAMLAGLRARGVPIDAVGLQFHVDAAHPRDLTSVRRNLERLAGLGLHILITELDVSVAHLSGTPAERARVQASIYAQIVDTCLAVPACDTITVFGVGDKATWDELGSAATAAPLLFSRGYRPKPALQAVRAALQARAAAVRIPDSSDALACAGKNDARAACSATVTSSAGARSSAAAVAR
jgi:endo-1,4-beta-xylanase